VKGIKLSKNGVPKVLEPLIKEENDPGFPATLQILNTILFASRALKLGTEPNTRPIEDPSKTSIPFLGKYKFQFWRDLGYRSLTGSVPGSLRFKRSHLTTKTGPNGHALWTSLADLDILYRDHIDLVQDIKLVGGDKLSIQIDTLSKILPLISKIVPVKGRSIRKLSWFPDKEMKTRVVAIGDYWSQCALKPLHHYLFRLLRKIPQDCTFDQGSFKDKVNGWEEFYSIDLTAATDRFPISIIYDVLNGHLPSTYLNSWKRIIVGKPFEFSGKIISYSVGNPMGFYSSWSSFAVAHHYVMYYCCRELNIPYKEAKYVLLGDDILIGDRLLKEKYCEVITSLGVEFSPIKTHESKFLFEFAKRLFFKGEEITPFPISSLKESAKRYYLLVNLLDEVSRKGWMTLEGIPQAIFLFYKTVIKRNTKFSAFARDESHYCELIMKVIRGTLAADKALNTLIRHFGYKVKRDLNIVEARSVLENVAVETFAASNPFNKYAETEGGYPLGKLAEDLVIFISTPLEDKEIELRAQEAITYVPVLNVYGQIEEAYTNLSNEAYRISTTGNGEWPLLLRTIALPIDDRIFVQRTSHLVSRASTIIGKILRERFVQLEIYLI
jgi:hypothetical protein